MRETQNMGLSQEALDWLDKHAERTKVKTCPTCKHTTGGGYDCEVYDKETGVSRGMFDDGPELYSYKTDRETVVEIVQAVPWSSGPCIFLCLQDKEGKKIGEWSQEEIDNA